MDTSLHVAATLWQCRRRLLGTPSHDLVLPHLLVVSQIFRLRRTIESRFGESNAPCEYESGSSVSLQFFSGFFFWNSFSSMRRGRLLQQRATSHRVENVSEKEPTEELQ